MKLFTPLSLIAVFPLTPALSRRERENCFQSIGKVIAANCSKVFILAELFSGRSLSQLERARVRESLRIMVVIAFAGCVMCVHAAQETNSPPPTNARDFYNAGTRLLAATNYAGAERMFRSALDAQDERVQAVTEFNLGHTRFADGAELLKKGPDAQKVSAHGRAALEAGERALRAGEASLADSQLDKMISAYLQGRGARQELRAAEKAVKAAMETFGKTLTRWRQAADDFTASAELNPADTNAAHNAELVNKKIAEQVDMLRQMQEMAGQMAGQKQQLAKMLSKLKGQIPAANAPPGLKGEDDEDGEGGQDGDIKPESLTGKEENVGREGEEMGRELSPDQAGQMLDALPVDGSKRLPMGGDKEGSPPKDKKGRNW